MRALIALALFALPAFAQDPSIVVRARATLAGNIGAIAQVRVNGITVGSREVRATTFTDHTFTLSSAVPAGSRIDVVFTNNGADSTGHDRNLYVDSVRVNGATLRPTDTGVTYDRGAGTAAFDGVSVIAGRIDMLWSGALRMRAPGETMPAGAIDIRTTGARCDGITDDFAAITTAIAQAKSKGVSVYIPPGNCAYGDVIRLTSSVKLIGAGDSSVLYALNPLRMAIYMYGSGSEITRLKLAGRKATTRRPNFEGTRITLFGATNFLIDKVTIDGATGAGIQTSVNGARAGTSNGRITNNVILNTLADAIHLTHTASYITVEGNRIENSGDDGIAVVSYHVDGGPTHHITARNNVVTNSRGGRSMSVVGGSDVLYENNRLSNSGNGACIYLAQEDRYDTQAVKNVTVRYNTTTNCGGLTLGHSAIMLFANWLTNENVQILRNDIVQGPNQTGIKAYGLNTGTVIDSNRITAGVLSNLGTLTATPYTSGLVGAQ